MWKTVSFKKYYFYQETRALGNQSRQVYYCMFAGRRNGFWYHMDWNLQ